MNHTTFNANTNANANDASAEGVNATMNEATGNTHGLNTQSSQPLRESVERALENYFAHLDGQPVNNLYDMVLSEIEIPLLETVMGNTRGNQSKAARLLGISRGTLRKKLKKYGID